MDEARHYTDHQYGTPVRGCRLCAPTLAVEEPSPTTDKHTPGPWRFLATPYHEDRAGIIEDAHQIYIASMFRISGPGDMGAQVEANARLIAAAPLMLDALRAGSAALMTASGCCRICGFLVKGTHRPTPNMHGCYIEDGCEHAIMRAAIAAATEEVAS